MNIKKKVTLASTLSIKVQFFFFYSIILTFIKPLVIDDSLFLRL